MAPECRGSPRQEANLALRFRNSNATGWLIPLLYAAGAVALGFTIPRLVYNFLPGYLSTVSVNAAIGIYSAVASGMMALTGIVFSLTFVMVQFSDTAYSPPAPATICEVSLSRRVPPGDCSSSRSASPTNL